MIWIAHGLYLILFLTVSFQWSEELYTIEEYYALPKVRQNKIYRKNWILLFVVLLFPFLDSFVRTSTTDAFLARLGPELITAGFFGWIVLLKTKPFALVKKLRWLPYVLFFAYTLWKNLQIQEGFLRIVLAEAWSLVTLAFFVLYNHAFIQNPLALPTAAQKEVQDAQLRAEFQERKRREAEELEKLRAENRAAEQARLQAEKDRRTHEAYERIVLGKKPSASDTSYGTSGDSYDYIDKRERVGASGISCCDNCRYYDGNRCTCRESLSYNETILTAGAYVCGYHKDR